ncbi:hypothetical protein M8332_05055 [Fructilactobacillus ixorae]|uniref:CopG family transcriptional regulator n=1 Tax=Fructilactobacillus ixorae TaxID=1750535 RepID=A0ABY5C2H2_9LACO|nr:hypothetical protein [Fructilactobacillus ixorae]USS92977.1 hypothetical protein M8332_05055 [Fructilactobacillus ixorae]
MSTQTNINIHLNNDLLHTITMLASAKGISVAAEIEAILTQHFAKPELVGMTDLVGTKISDRQLQDDGLVKLHGVLYFYQLVDTNRHAHETYVVAEVSEQKIYLVAKGEYYAGN